MGADVVCVTTLSVVNVNLGERVDVSTECPENPVVPVTEPVAVVCVVVLTVERMLLFFGVVCTYVTTSVGTVLVFSVL